MFDVFYNGTKPNLFPHEQPAESLSDARKKCRTKFFWLVPGEQDFRLMNFNWVPLKWEEHQTHIFQLYSQWEEFTVTFAPRETLPLIENWHDRDFIQRRTVKKNWKIVKEGISWIIDPNWCPNPFDPPYIYVFGNPWYSAEEMTTVEYHVPEATERKYVNEPVVSLLPVKERWSLMSDSCHLSDPDWCPNPFDPPYIYVFGNQWYPAEEMETAEYRMPGATEKKYINEPVVKILPNKEKWSIPEEIDASKIDFSWVPSPHDPPYIYHFGTEFQESVGLTYTVPGATEIKLMGESPLIDNTSKPTQILDMFFVDMNNKTSVKRFDVLKVKCPNVQKIRFMNGWVETLKRCAVRSNSTKFWVVSSENIYDDFNFEWHAPPWQNSMTHVFASQWQKWSDTFLINKNEFARHAKWAKDINQFPNLNFVSEQPVYRPDDLYDIYYVDHFNSDSEEYLAKIQKRYPDVKKARYVDNYLDTFKRIVSTAESEYIWIVNSICDYSKFDFTWQPDTWQAKMLHVFPSSEQKFGDTFYLHVPSFKEQMDNLERLDWFEVVNYCTEQSVTRLPVEIVTYASDSVVDEIKKHTFTGPYAIFKHTSVKDTLPNFTPSVWRNKDRAVHVLSRSGSVVSVPREAKTKVNVQVYDYPYILPHKDLYVKDKDLDIVYLSNGEPDAEYWYEHLQTVVPNQTIHRIKDINGRAEAYKAAARVSTTPWFFAVFAKLEVNPEFDWTWQPDYLQQPKSYVFTAKNPVNGLIYGHQAMICYNKKLVLETDTYELDFTLSKPHEVVDILSGTAHFNIDPWTTWRTSFREVVKLKEYAINKSNDSEALNRLQTWLTLAEGSNSEWCLRGAADAIEYYTRVNGEMKELMYSVEWNWLKEYFLTKYPSESNIV